MAPGEHPGGSRAGLLGPYSLPSPAPLSLPLPRPVSTRAIVLPGLSLPLVFTRSKVVPVHSGPRGIPGPIPAWSGLVMSCHLFALCTSPDTGSGDRDPVWSLWHPRACTGLHWSLEGWASVKVAFPAPGPLLDDSARGGIWLCGGLRILSAADT